ncbi:MAG: serine/threonine-protein kinase PknK, partial [Myxococcota bacterium]
GAAADTATLEALREGDMRSAEIGQPQLECLPTFNLAELLLWDGELDEAMERALRARSLQERFFAEEATPLDPLLVARIACARGEPEPAREALAWIAEHCADDALPPATAALIDLVRLSASDLEAGADAPAQWSSEGTWRAAIAALDQHGSINEQQETRCLAAAVARACGRDAVAATWVADGLALDPPPRWAARLRSL